MDDTTQIVKTAVEVVKAPVQIVKLPVGAVSMAFQMSMSGAYGIQAITSFYQMIKQRLDYEQAVGGADMKKLIEVSGGDVQLLQMPGKPEKRLQEMLQLFKKYQIPHSMAPELNKDGMAEIMFPTNATPRVNLIIDKMEIGKIETPEEYINNADPKLLAAELNGYDPEAPTEKLVSNTTLSNIPVEGQATVLKPDDIPLAQRKIIEQMQINMKMGDESRQAFSLNVESLVKSQDEESVLTRIPGTDNYVRFPKREAFLIDNDQTLLVFTDKKAEVSIFNNLNQHIDTMNFEQLHKLHYDRVSKMSRRRVDQAKIMKPVPSVKPPM